MSLFPGLPALPISFPNVLSGVIPLVADLLGALSGAAPPLWGIFLDGFPVVLADNVVSLEFKQDFRVANYPVEKGAFSSYNKVQMPFEVRIRFSTGGSASDREAFIDSIAAVISDTNLYDVVTPEVTYFGVNLTHQDYRRVASSVGLLSIDVWCQEIRSASLSTSASADRNATQPNETTPTAGTGTAGSGTVSRLIVQPSFPSAATQVNDGTVQAQQPTASQQQAVDSVLSQSSLPF